MSKCNKYLVFGVSNTHLVIKPTLFSQKFKVLCNSILWGYFFCQNLGFETDILVFYFSHKTIQTLRNFFSHITYQTHLCLLLYFELDQGSNHLWHGLASLEADNRKAQVHLFWLEKGGGYLLKFNSRGTLFLKIAQ